jgi:hypothetical protein
VQTLALSVLGKALDASRLQEILYSHRKLIKGEGKNVDLRVDTLPHRRSSASMRW